MHTFPVERYTSLQSLLLGGGRCSISREAGVSFVLEIERSFVSLQVGGAEPGFSSQIALENANSGGVDGGDRFSRNYRKNSFAFQGRGQERTYNWSAVGL